MLSGILRVIRNVVWGVGLALTFFAAIECIRAYEVLRDLHPALGYAFAFLVWGGLAALAAWYGVSLWRRPPVLRAPPEYGPAGAAGSRAYARFLVRVLKRLRANVLVSPEAVERLDRHRERLLVGLRSGGGDDALRAMAEDAEAEAVAPALSVLDELADREVRAGVRDVMLAVTLSPWRSVDLLVVLYRNLGMVVRVSRIYQSRPRAREQLAILHDVASVVATVNFLNYGSRLFQNLTASLPVLGRFADDVAQGIGAGLLTSIAGHSAAERCRAVRGWSAAQAQAGVRRKLKTFLVDVKNVMRDEIVPRIRAPVETQIPEEARRPGLQDRIGAGIALVIDQTADMVDLFLVRPVAVAGRGVTLTTGAMGTVLAWSGRAAWRAAASGARWAGRTVQSLTRSLRRTP